MDIDATLGGGILVVTGPPGAGKSTVAPELVALLGLGVLVEGDGFFHAVRSGWIPPWQPASQQQNVVVIEAMAAAADRYAAGGYGVVVDGIIGPWMLPVFTARIAAAAAVHYVVLRPSEEVTVGRATARMPPDLVDPEPIAKMYAAFAELGDHERHVVDSSADDAAATVARIVQRLGAGELRLPNER